jgi:hypothetical protein
MQPQGTSRDPFVTAKRFDHPPPHWLTASPQLYSIAAALLNRRSFTQSPQLYSIAAALLNGNVITDLVPHLVPR